LLNFKNFSFSGLMLSYSMINKLEKSNGKFNYISYILKRWLRLSVSHFGSILIIYLLPLTGSGPIWHRCYQLFQPTCRSTTSLMSNFLYYNNWNEAIRNYPLEDFEFWNIVSIFHFIIWMNNAIMLWINTSAVKLILELSSLIFIFNNIQWVWFGFKSFIK
jgi:hypothetical protein